MQNKYHARWVSKARADELKRNRMIGPTLLLDTFNGILVVEPVGDNLGDGPVLPRPEADYELQPAWFIGPKAKLREARQRLGLDGDGPQTPSAM